MAKEIVVSLHSIDEDGLPNEEQRTGRVAFVWDGYVVSGWPISPEFSSEPNLWEPADDRFGGPVRGVTHWVEFPVPTWRLQEA